MTKAQVGHSALDATAGIVETLAALPDPDTRVRFLRAGVELAERQLDAAEEQHTKITAKWESVTTAWETKIDEADDIRLRASDDLAALNRELEALEG